MKSLGGGKLLHRAKEAIEYSRVFPFSRAVAIGMKDEREIDYNADLFENKQPSEEIKAVNRIFVFPMAVTLVQKFFKLW